MNDKFGDQQKWFKFLEYIEDKWECAGLCKSPKFYVFSDINKGKPKAGCLPEVEEWFWDLLDNMYIILIIIVIVLILAIMFSFTLCCCPKEEK